MNAIRFGLYTGILWAGASLLLIELSILNGAPTAWVELDFRFLSGIALIILHSLDLGANLSELIHYAQFGMPANALNTIIALLTGFIDGFVSGFFIAIFYNFLSIISEGKNFPTTIKFGIATGIVLGICSWIAQGSLLSGAMESYLTFPHSYGGAVQWGLWGFVDGFIGGVSISYLFLKIKSRLQQ